MSFSWQSVAKTVIYISFKQNQKTLANTVCVNKGKPKSCCQAKCYLDNEIKKEDGRQNNLPSSLKDKIEKTEILSGYLKFDFTYEMTGDEVVFFYFESVSKYFPKKIIQPPQRIRFS
jgi:hypothetical protein